jgi:DNA invertase Pin-like site-specific DNA recombinase
MIQPNTPEVISLIRFSTAEQVSEGKAGIDGQRQVNASSAAYHGLKIRREVVVVDVSGRHVAEDPQFQALFEELKDPTLSGILVPEQSRIVRPETFDDYPILGHFQRNKKLIYTPTGRIDPNTPEGRMALTVGGMMSGEELHNLRSRFARGKATKRLEGKHVGGNQMLPKTVKFVRERNAEGVRTGKCHWELVTLEAERMKLAFQLLFEGDSYELISEKVGGGWAGSSLHRAMMNPIHIGIRRYDAEAKGVEYRPTPKPATYAKHEPGWEPKKRRKLAKRAEPLDVPTREDLESGKAQPIVEPILTLAEWDRAQAIIAERMTHWRKSKLKNEGRDRFVASGIGRCSCGETLYTKYGSRGSHLDSYICRTRHPKGAGCGMKSIKRVDLDAAIAETMAMLADAAFLASVLDAALALREVKPDPARIERERALAKLASGRKEMLAMVRAGEMTRDEFKEQIAALDSEVRALEALVPAPVPQVDQQAIVQAFDRAFAEFGVMSFTHQRAVLRGAVKSIIVDSHARTITSMTISGGYLGRGANSVLHSRTQSGISAVPDLTIRFPHPVVIADTYVDRRTANGNHPNTVATQWRRVA